MAKTRPPKPSDRPANPRFRQRKEPKGQDEKQGDYSDIVKALVAGTEARQVWDEIDTVHHRAAAIMAAVYVEKALENLVKRALLIGAATNNLFVYPAPLSAFAAKIDIGFSLGLYTTLVRRDLDEIRLVRNEFAHSERPLTFNSTEVFKRVGRLGYVKWLIKQGDQAKLRLRNVPRPHDSAARTWYVYTCRLLENHLFWAAFNRLPIPPPKEPIPGSDDPVPDMPPTSPDKS